MESVPQSEAETKPPISAPLNGNCNAVHTRKRYADVYAGVRQDSGDPAYFVKMVRDFYDKEGITGEKTVVFSDSLTIDLCVQYRQIALESGFQPVFGVGTFFTSK